MAEQGTTPFARMLISRRLDAGLTQVELAELASLGVRTVSDLERGVSQRARQHTARQLADALGLAGRDRAEFLALARGMTAPSAVTLNRTLPLSTGPFTGREAELARLTGLAGTAGIQAINGMAGIGKTALAVRAAHLVADRFPDRQLFVDLHGHSAGRPPASPADVLAILLAADGVSPGSLPGDLDGRAALWKARMAGQRGLLILDNAASSDQVTPLLPEGPGCLVLMTSRRYLADLPQAAAGISLGTLPPGDALRMFLDLAPRAAGEPAKVAELAAVCGYLPLAISLLARLFIRHQAWRMDDLIEASRTRLLSAAAEDRTVAAALDLSYQYLSTERQWFFQRLAAHPGTGIDAAAAAALTGLPQRVAAAHLDGLHRDRLLDEPAPHRYRMHPLVRWYAQDLAAASGSGPDRAIGPIRHPQD